MLRWSIEFDCAIGIDEKKHLSTYSNWKNLRYRPVFLSCDNKRNLCISFNKYDQ